MIQPERILALNRKAVGRGDFVLYWMQASQRAQCNHALEYAIGRANELGLPLVAGFGLTDEYPQANARHYAFLLEGLAETATALARRGVQLVVRPGSPDRVAAELAGRAALLVADCGYLDHQRRWRRRVARAAPCRVVQAETDVVVPVRAASEKEEYAARTIRPRLHRQWERYLVPLRPRRLRRDSLGLDLGGIDVGDPHSVLDTLDVDRGVAPVSGHYRGGGRAAVRLLREFIRTKLPAYAADRNDPGLDIQSHMSPYLHFGQISPLEIALAVRAATACPPAAKDAYLEELLVRRELCMNFVFYNPAYASWRCLPSWARATLARHQSDRRERVYSRRRLESARTQDPYWNAAMREMLLTGKMHNYMRMYWGKKVLQWTRSPRAAFRLLLALNNRYFLDGRDPASYTNVAWCFGKHDRPWGEREVFGTVRYMNAAGLERKFDMPAYLRRVPPGPGPSV